MTEFEPYITRHGIDGLRFLVATPEGRDWYDPLKPYTKLEYKWITRNIDFDGPVIDAGCHHGNYSVLFGTAPRLVCVDAHGPNCDIARANLALNETRAEVINCAVMDYDGWVLFNEQSNGRVGSGKSIKCMTLKSICHDAHVVKLDVEGAEFRILPAAIDDMPDVHTWIVEVHPTDGDPNKLTAEFITRGFDVLKVDRDIMDVVAYADAMPWTTHATIIARRP